MSTALYASSGSLGVWLEDLPWPGDFIQPLDLPDFLHRIHVLDYRLHPGDDHFTATVSLAIQGAPAVRIPGLDGIELRVGSQGGGLAIVHGSVRVAQDWSITIRDLEVTLAVEEGLLRAAPSEGDADAERRDHVEISTRGTLRLTHTFDLEIEGFDAVDLSPVEIGTSGIVISASGLKLDLSRTSALPEVEAAGFGPDFLGLWIGEADLRLPDGLPLPEDLKLQNAAIGSGGVSGTLSTASGPPVFDEQSGTYQGDGAGELFGFPFARDSVELEIKQNALRRAEITGEIYLPYFEKRLAVTAGLDLDGGVNVEITGPADPADDVDADTGLLRLTKDGLFDLLLESIAFRQVEGDYRLILTGTLTVTAGDLDLPGVQLRELAIDAKGRVHLDGGWIDLPDQYSLDFHGFNLELTRFGLGRDDDRAWFGFNGGLKLIDEVPAGASVKGLRVSWSTTAANPLQTVRVSLQGVGLELEVPEVLRLKGEVSYAPKPIPGGGTDDRFDGAIRLELLALDMSIDARLAVGHWQPADGESFFYLAIYIGVELPAGIPLFSTGLSLYGMAALYAQQMEPDRKPEEAWYRMEQTDSWFHRGETGVVDFGKWAPQARSLALGAGVTLGTTPDNGYAVSGRLLLIVLLPGPMIMLHGAADLMKDRNEGGHEGTFQALAVLDNRERNLTVGLDAAYKQDAQHGRLLSISAAAEAFYDFDDPRAWYIHLGKKEPRDQRIRASALSLYEAESYLMLDPSQLATGIWVGYDRRFNFGPLGLTVEAWVESNVLISFKPTHFYGDLWLHGQLALRVFGFSAGLGLDARLAAQVFDPFHVVGSFAAWISLPWPLPDFDVEVSLEWGPEPNPPAIPNPVQDVTIGHEKVTTTWPLPRTTSPDPDSGGSYAALLIPDYQKDGFLRDTVGAALPSRPSATAAPPAADALPIVPVDARPQLTFGRPVHDEVGMQTNYFPVTPAWEVVGDPDTGEGPVEVRYRLVGLRLSEWRPGNGDGQPDQWVQLPELYGAWHEESNTKLILWSKSGFDYDRHTGGLWEEAMLRHQPDALCPIGDWRCYPYGRVSNDDFAREGGAPDRGCFVMPPLRSSAGGNGAWLRLTHEELGPEGWPVVFWLPQERLAEPYVASGPGGGAIVFGQTSFEEGEPLMGSVVQRVVIHMPRPARSVSLKISGGKYGSAGWVVAHGATDEILFQQWQIEPNDSEPRRLVLTSEAGEIACLELIFVGTLRIARICIADRALDGFTDEAMERIDRVRESLFRWSQEDHVLRPETTYRLEIETVVEARGRGDFSWYAREWLDSEPLLEHAFFRTGAPPGLGALSTPIGVDPEQSSTGLDDLTPYVRQTVPVSVRGEGEPNALAGPAFRAYDVGVDLNENYVDLLYRMAGQDLMLYLYDDNGEPIRGTDGGLVVVENPWGRQEELVLHRSERRWLDRVEQSSCLDGVDPAEILRDERLSASEETQVLQPDTVYEARLSPLLLREDFAAGNLHALDGSPDDDGAFPGSDWRVEAAPLPGADGAERQILRQRSNGPGGTNAPTARFLFTTARPATANTGSRRDPSTWTDVRLSLHLGFAGSAAGTAGIAFRYKDAQRHFRLLLDTGGALRLDRLTGGIVTELGRVDAHFDADRDYHLVVEAVDDRLRVTLDGEPAFDVRDEAAGHGLRHGAVALLASGAGRAYFVGLRVDDFGADVPVLYGFRFVTSAFANFHHQIHSFQDEVWRAELPADAWTAALDALAASDAREIPPAAAPGDTATPLGPPPEAEWRSYERLRALVGGGQDTVQNLDVTELVAAGGGSGTDGGPEPRIFHLRTPEPLDWNRVGLAVAARQGAQGEPGDTAGTPPASGDRRPPEAVKITEVHPGAESAVELLLREPTDVSRWSVEYRRGAGSGFAPSFDGPIHIERFQTDPAAAGYQAFWSGLADWCLSDAAFHARLGEGERAALVRAQPDRRDAVWRASLELPIDREAPQTPASVGLLFRVAGHNDYLLLSVGTEGHSLHRVASGVGKTLWANRDVPPSTGLVDLRVEARAGRLEGFMNDVPLFAVDDADGAAAGYGVAAEGVSVAIRGLAHAEAALDGALFHEEFGHPQLAANEHLDAETALEGWSFVDEPPYTTQEGEWLVRDGFLHQTSNIYGFVGAPYNEPGTHALTGDPTWSDYRTVVQLRSGDDDSIGILFRFQNEENYYRFSMDAERRYRRLIRRVDDEILLIWSDEVPYEVDRDYVITIDAVGSRLTGYVDGVEIFSVTDPALVHGKIGLYCRANDDARFHDVRVLAPQNGWIPFHRFGEERRRPAGRRILLTHGAPPEEVTGRETHELESEVGTRLPAAGVGVRLVDPDGRIRQRRWWSAAPLASISATIVRGRDGAGLFLRVDDAPRSGVIDVDSLRLAWVFQRSIDTLVLRQHGDESPESAVQWLL